MCACITFDYTGCENPQETSVITDLKRSGCSRKCTKQDARTARRQMRHRQVAGSGTWTSMCSTPRLIASRSSCAVVATVTDANCERVGVASPRAAAAGAPRLGVEAASGSAVHSTSMSGNTCMHRYAAEHGKNGENGGPVHITIHRLKPPVLGCRFIRYHTILCTTHERGLLTQPPAVLKLGALRTTTTSRCLCPRPCPGSAEAVTLPGPPVCCRA